MAGEMKPEKSDSLAARMKSDVPPPLVERDKDARKNVLPSHTSSRISLSNPTATMKGETGEHPAAELGVYYPPTSCYPYYYPVYNGNFNQFNNQGYLYAGSSSYKSDDGSHPYYLPAYNNYSAAGYMGVDGNQPYYSSPGYLQNACAYGSEVMPQYYLNATQAGEATHGTVAGRGGAKLSLSSDILENTKFSDDQMKRYNFLDTKSHSSDSTKFYGSLLYDQSLSKSHQLGSSYMSTGDGHKSQPYGKWSSFTGSKQGGCCAHDLTCNSGSSSSKKPVLGELGDTTDLTRGPRRHCKSIIPLNSSAEKEQTGNSMSKYQFNSEDFRTEYNYAKFYVIKSYNEDNIHKSVKYNVWSSTPDGNKKLDAAFRAKMAEKSEAGIGCPIFLFFSVNGSGQFVGVAQMTGPVDFENNLNFWEHNKWNGFFPVKWHIIKDVPNAQLRHIILENNDNRPVTFTRDCQEIGLEQGLEMLRIFKSFAGETSLLEDFSFYEKREQSVEGKRNAAPQTEIYGSRDPPKFKKDYKRVLDEESGGSSNFSGSTSVLINLAKSLSLSD